MLLLPEVLLFLLPVPRFLPFVEALGFGVPAIVLNNAGSPEHILASGAGFVLPNINSLPEQISMLLLKVARRSTLNTSATEIALDSQPRLRIRRQPT